MQVYIGGQLTFDIDGTEKLEETFKAFTANVKRSIHMNSQQLVEIGGYEASGTVYCLVQLVTEEDGQEKMTQHSVIYQDKYVCQEGAWLIKERISNFNVTVETNLEEVRYEDKTLSKWD